MYKLEDLMTQCKSVSTEINGKWVTARPLSFGGWYGMVLRIKDAWAVLRGKADAFKWPEGQ